MTTSTTFNVHFWLKKTAIKKDGTFSIYARITVDGERADLSTKQSVLEGKWCSTARRVKSKYTGAKEINDSLDAIYFKLRDCHKNLKDAGIVISAKAVKLNFLGNDKVVQTINDLIKFHNDFELKKLANGTTKNYPSTLKYLKRFLLKNYNCSDLYLKKVDYTFVVNFEKYLRNCSPLKKSQPLGNNGIMKHMERLQKLTTLAFKHGWINNNPFSLYKLKFEVYDSPFLEQKEIDALILLQTTNKSIQRVRDIFVFSCYTGLCYIEVKNLKKKSIVNGIDGEQWIMVRRQKTSTPVKVPLLDEAKEILKLYKEYPSVENRDNLLPVFSSQKVNQYLKTIAMLCGIDKKLTFHVARHSFATTITLLNDVPISTVSKLLSHKKISTTQKYARVIETKISRDMLNLKKTLKENDLKKESSKRLTSQGHLKIV